MKLTRVRIEGFQAHERTVFEPDPHVTAIVGRSDVGKSSIVRALRWVLTGRPAGTGMIRDGSDKAVVVLEFDDGTVVERVRGRSQLNRYTVRPKGGQEVVFDNFGTGVPEPVLDVFGPDLHVDVGGQPVSMNVGSQKERPFFVGFTPGERTQLLQMIVGDDLDAVAKQYISESRSAHNAEVAAAQRLDGLRASEKEASKRAEAVSNAVRVSEGWLRHLNDCSDRLKWAEGALQRRQGALETVRQAEEAVRASLAAEPAREALTALQGAMARLQGAVSLQARREGARTALAEVEQGLAAGAVAAAQSAALEALSPAIRNLIRLQDLNFKILAVRREAQAAEQRMGQADQERARTAQDLQTVAAQLGSCPECGRPF